MNYELVNFTIKNLILDDVLQELRVVTDIVVAITDDPRFQVYNYGIEFIIKNFDGYNELSAYIKTSVQDWVIANYPNK